jgi:melibiose permease/lactose/raffinose/galactose permease
MQEAAKQNRLTFGLSTIGRDMVFSLITMYLIYYLTDVIYLPTGILWWVAGIILFACIFDALNDPFMGFIVDNTYTRWGKFKPWIAAGALLTSLFSVLTFTDFKLEGTSFIAMFAVFYIL